MKVFLDTSVLVPALVIQHADHARCFEVLEKVQSGEHAGSISTHTLAETYAILTKLPPPFRHSPSEALLSLQENVLEYFKPISLSASDYASFIKEAAVAGVQGGTIYDALLLKCAAKDDPQRIYTLNLKHFRAVATPELAPRLAAP
jgi:predicted nucleic acid-binding protein